MKVLNLYAGIGGNRKLWDNNSDDIEVTAVEINPEIALIYQSFFPKDKVIIADAHAYLLEHYAEFDFIWSSPPCPNHSKLRYLNKIKMYPDMKLYEEILFLKHFYKGRWVIENVCSYYKPLIEPLKLGNHYIWANFDIPFKEFKPYGKCKSKNEVTNLKKKFFDLKGYKVKNKRLLLRNCVDFELGVYIFNHARSKIPLS